MRQRLVVTNSESNAPSRWTLSTPAASLYKRSRPVGPIPLPGPRNGLYQGATMSCASLVSFRTRGELASYAARPDAPRQPELSAIPTVRVDPDHVAGRVERRSAGERHIQIGRVGPDAQYERVAAGEQRERPPRGWVASGRGRRVRRHPPVLAHE